MSYVAGLLRKVVRFLGNVSFLLKKVALCDRKVSFTRVSDSFRRRGDAFRRRNVSILHIFVAKLHGNAPKLPISVALPSGRVPFPSCSGAFLISTATFLRYIVAPPVRKATDLASFASFIRRNAAPLHSPSTFLETQANGGELQDTGSLRQDTVVSSLRNRQLDMSSGSRRSLAFIVIQAHLSKRNS